MDNRTVGVNASLSLTMSNSTVETESTVNGTYVNASSLHDGSSDGTYTHETITYIVIGIVGALGNGFVIVMMVSSKEVRKKIPNILIIHQSIIDAFTSVLLILTSANTYDNKGDHYGLVGELYCRIWAMKVPLWSAFMVSTYNLLVLTIERYIEIVHPLFHKVSFGRAHLFTLMVLVWIIVSRTISC